MIKTAQTNYGNWIEFDYNPFILFSSSGEIITLNQSAQFLTSKVSARTLYELALAYAPLQFGFKTTFIDMRYDVFNFFAVTIGYENEEEIGIKLYQSPFAATKKSVTISHFEPANIYLLLDACLLNLSAKKQLAVRKEFDPTLPDIKLPQNQFLKIVGKVFEGFLGCDAIHATLKIKTGEFLQLEGKKYQILLLKVAGENRNGDFDAAIDALAQEINLFAYAEEKAISLHIPVIL